MKLVVTGDVITSAFHVLNSKLGNQLEGVMT